ncbi:hypothetical protein LTR28_002336 [Elasticomyces elasticus]|nr:hypothetical protein LTR28_002336 [Elasticomyces elasticus]
MSQSLASTSQPHMHVAGARIAQVNYATHASLAHFLASYFPTRARDVLFLYHVPRSLAFNAQTAPVERIVLSITPTEGVYSAISRPSARAPLVFLHRPFTLDRSRVRRGTTVVSSHVGFDEVLTVGWNTALAARLGIDVAKSSCVQGYKGDPSRRIGIIGHVTADTGSLSAKIQNEFGGWDGVYGFSPNGSEQAEKPVKVVAIMNAFRPEEIERVLLAAHEKQWVPDPKNGSEILYLTGQVREPGLAAALATEMNIICVGHRAAEEWGIRFLASELRQHYPLLEVEEVYEEEEEEVVPRNPKTPASLPP